MNWHLDAYTSNGCKNRSTQKKIKRNLQNALDIDSLCAILGINSPVALILWYGIGREVSSGWVRESLARWFPLFIFIPLTVAGTCGFSVESKRLLLATQNHTSNGILHHFYGKSLWNALEASHWNIIAYYQRFTKSDKARTWCKKQTVQKLVFRHSCDLFHFAKVKSLFRRFAKNCHSAVASASGMRYITQL